MRWLALVGIAMVLTACADGNDRAAPVSPTRTSHANAARTAGSTTRHASRSRPVVIDAAAHEVFRPTPVPQTGHRLTARQAWLRWDHLQGGHQHDVPAELAVRYGSLTLPPQYSDRPVYGYSETQVRRCLSTVAIANPGLCREWTFLDAKSGRELDMTGQRVRASR